MPETRPLRVFLCHASQDKPAVRELYRRLKAENWIDPWLDEEKLLPGQDWDLEIYKAIREADAIIVCLSKESVAKEGYVQKEFKRALNLVEEKPEGTIYVIPLRLNDCQPPVKFQQWQWVDYFSAGAQEKLLKALRIRFDGLQPKIAAPKPSAPDSAPAPAEDLDLYRFIKITSMAVSTPFWIAKYPVTNAQYARFLKADDYANPDFGTGFPMFDGNCIPIGDWGDAGLQWLKEQLKDYEFFPPEMWKVEPRNWNNPGFGIAKPDNPVVGISWFEANAYCKWLAAHWAEQPEYQVNPGLKPVLLRLPLEAEWVAAAGGNKPEGRFPWDLPGQATVDKKAILEHANVAQKNGDITGYTTPVMVYLNDKSLYGLMDMAGNVWEWQANYSGNEFGDEKELALRGGSWFGSQGYTRVPNRGDLHPLSRNSDIGFRVAAFLSG
jgi:formylglycine-generating enzyme required for sulfatase activity